MPFKWFEPKILVEIIGENGIKSRKKYLVEDDKVMITRGRKGRGGAGWTPTFNRDCLLPYYVGIWPFRRLKHKLMVIENHASCISFRAEGIDKSMIDFKEYFNAGAMKNAGATLQSIKIPPFLYLMLGAVLIMGFINLLLVTGRLRF